MGAVVDDDYRSTHGEPAATILSVRIFCNTPRTSSREVYGRFCFWGRPPGRRTYLRVVVTGDRRALHNAFFDENFTRKQRRKEREG
jgi:hypothetical protein